MKLSLRLSICVHCNSSSAICTAKQHSRICRGELTKFLSWGNHWCRTWMRAQFVAQLCAFSKRSSVMPESFEVASWARHMIKPGIVYLADCNAMFAALDSQKNGTPESLEKTQHSRGEMCEMWQHVGQIQSTCLHLSQWCICNQTCISYGFAIFCNGF